MKYIRTLALFCIAAALAGAAVVGAPAKAADSAKAAAADVAPIDINSASAEQLQTVPGITAAIAKKIIAGRPYTSKHDIVKQGFITQQHYESIKARLAAKWAPGTKGAKAGDAKGGNAKGGDAKGGKAGDSKAGAKKAAPAADSPAQGNTQSSAKSGATRTIITGDMDPELALSIREIIEKYYKGTFWIGAAPVKTMLEPAGRAKLDIFHREFPHNTPTNAFKQSSVYLEHGAPWKNEEYMKWIELARANNQNIRAHGPASPQCSTWAKDPARTKQELGLVMTHHMTRLSQELEKNKDVVLWMDVVNETVVANENLGGKFKRGDWFGSLGKDANGKIIFWQNPWREIGTDPKSGIPLYIIMAFELANKHAPGIKKIYNQNGGGKDAEAWNKIKKTILYLRSIGQKVDGLGWQAHVQLGWEKDPGNKKGIVELIDWCHANNLEFHITELNVNCQNESNWKNKRDAQAATIKAVLDTALENRHKGVVTVNFWDINSSSRNLSGNKNNYFGGIWHQAIDYNDPVYLAIKRSLLEHGRK